MTLDILLKLSDQYDLGISLAVIPSIMVARCGGELKRESGHVILNTSGIRLPLSLTAKSAAELGRALIYLAAEAEESA